MLKAPAVAARVFLFPNPKKSIALYSIKNTQHKFDKQITAGNVYDKPSYCMTGLLAHTMHRYDALSAATGNTSVFKSRRPGISVLYYLKELSL
jgi:hypothetical protein